MSIWIQTFLRICTALMIRGWISLFRCWSLLLCSLKLSFRWPVILRHESSISNNYSALMINHALWLRFWKTARLRNMILTFCDALEAARSLLFIGSRTRRLAVLALSGPFVTRCIRHDIVSIPLMMIVSPPWQWSNFLKIKSQTRQLFLEIATQCDHKGRTTGDLSNCLLF